ncbi:histidinol-phosphate transaminase [Verrucomicrobiota bacterium]
MSDFIRKSVQNMTGYVPGEQVAGDGIVKLNTNENPYPPAPGVERALRELDIESLRRYPNPVSTALTDRIAEIHGCAASQVFVGNGSDEVLALCTRAFVEDGGAIGYFDPSYSLYPVLADIRDVTKKPVPLADDFGWAMPDGYSADLFFLTLPNAPTGLLYPKQVIREFCAGFDGVVVIDEAYVDFASENCMELAGEFENVLVARSLSKSYSLAGLRVGYAVGAAGLVEALMKLKDSYNLDAVSQALALAALQDVEYMKGNVAKIRESRSRLSEALREMGHTVYPSEANFIWVRPQDVDARKLFEELKARGILIRYFEGERTGEFVRITVGTDAEIDKLLESVSMICS